MVVPAKQADVVVEVELRGPPLAREGSADGPRGARILALLRLERVPAPAQRVRLEACATF